MRILVLTNLYPPHFLGGYELICQRVCEALAVKGHPIEILTSDYEVAGAKGTVPPFPVARQLRIHGFYGRPWLNIHALSRLEAENNRRLREAIARHRPELVYVWNLGGLSKSMLLTLQRMEVPTVFYLSDHWIARGLKADVWLNWWNRSNPTFVQKNLRRYWNWSGQRTKWDSQAPTDPIQKIQFRRLYFCSRALRKRAVEAGFDVGHGAVIYCPVNVEKFTGPIRKSRGPIQRWLYVGRLAADKGVMTALKAVALLPPATRGSLALYGRGDAGYEKDLKSFVREHNLPVSFHAISAEEMPEVYRAHDALLFPSEWEEPFALTPLEAMASGLPVIGTTTGGSAELFRPKENALTYQAGDAAELAARMKEFSVNLELRDRCAMTAQAEVRQRNAEPAIVSQVEEYLLETLEHWPGFGASQKSADAASLEHNVCPIEARAEIF